MIIDIARNYPRVRVEDTDWYRLNNIITPEIEAARIKYKIKQERLGSMGPMYPPPELGSMGPMYPPPELGSMGYPELELGLMRPLAA